MRTDPSPSTPTLPLWAMLLHGRSETQTSSKRCGSRHGRAQAPGRGARRGPQEHLSSIRSGFSRAADDERARLSFLTPFMAHRAAVVFTSPADSTYWPAARACKILHPPQPYDGGKHQEDDRKNRNPLKFLLPAL